MITHERCASQNGYTPLHLASYDGYVDVARLLIEMNAPLDLNDKVRRTNTTVRESRSEPRPCLTCMCAVRVAEWVHAAAQRLRKWPRGRCEASRREGRDDRRDREGAHAEPRGHNNSLSAPNHPLAENNFAASRSRHIESRSLTYCARCAAQRGYTPLLIASSKGHVEVARVLIEEGAPLDAKDIVRARPVRPALSHAHTYCARRRMGTRRCILLHTTATSTWRSF